MKKIIQKVKFVFCVAVFVLALPVLLVAMPFAFLIAVTIMGPERYYAWVNDERWTD